MNQDSREALIELLFLSLYLDQHLSLAEDRVVQDALETIGWESAKPREICLLNAFAKVKEVSADLERTQAFVNERAEVVKRAGDEASAMTWLSRVLSADGVTGTERYFLDRLQKIWFGGV